MAKSRPRYHGHYQPHIPADLGFYDLRLEETRIAQAAFAGCLVVGRNSAGTKEILDITGGYPFLTDDEMLSAMESVVELPERDYHQKILSAQDKAKVCFSKENYINTVYELYKSLLN